VGPMCVGVGGGGPTADGAQDESGRWGAARDERWTVRIDSKEGEDSVGYRERAQAAARLVSRLRGESQIALCHRPRLGPLNPAARSHSAAALPRGTETGSARCCTAALLHCCRLHFWLFLLARCITAFHVHVHASLCCHRHVSTWVAAWPLDLSPTSPRRLACSF
jgi:hypothetical protein